MQHEISVVIPVRDDLSIGRCLRSFDDARARPLVVLNDATDAVRHIVRDNGVDHVELTEPGGPAACEYGIAAAPVDHILMMDSDCVFLPGVLGRFVDAVGTADFVRGLTLFRHRTRAQRIVAKVRARHTNAPHMVFKVPLMIDRRIRERIGGYVFDPRLSWTEDYDLTMRIRGAGAQVRIMREAVVVHEALTPCRDLRSLYHYGEGHREGVELGLSGYRPVHATGAFTGLAREVRSQGLGVAAYGLLSNVAFVAGYQHQKRRGKP